MEIKVIIGSSALVDKLSKRMSKKQIVDLSFEVKRAGIPLDSICDLLFYGDNRVSWNTGWLLNQMNDEELQQLRGKRFELISFVSNCEESGRQRLALNILSRFTDWSDNDVVFLDFCMNIIMDLKQTPAVRCLGLKIAYSICLCNDDLLRELFSVLQFMEEGELPPSVKSCVKSIHRDYKKSGKRKK